MYCIWVVTLAHVVCTDERVVLYPRLLSVWEDVGVIYSVYIAT